MSENFKDLQDWKVHTAVSEATGLSKLCRFRLDAIELFASSFKRISR